MSNVKYIAAGYLKDSDSLLKDFVKENSTNFTVFITKWKEHNFVAIFLGRDKHELQQFTHEIFQLTLGYLQNSLFMYQVGAVYLLYALYRNQISVPPVRIRIVLSQWKVMKRLQVLAEENFYMHLHYVINFMYGNSFDFVAHAQLFGPRSSKGKTELEKPTSQTTALFKELRSNMTNFHNSNILEEMKELGNEYTRLRQKLFPTTKVENKVDVSELGEYNNCLESLVHDGTYSRCKLNSKSGENDIGGRRAKIKATQFARKVLFKQLNPSDSEEEQTEVTKTKRKRKFRRRRKPKEERRVGRPRKGDTLERLLLESDGNESCNDVYKIRDYSRKRGPSTKTSYLQKYEMGIPINKEKVLKGIATKFSSESSEESLDSKKGLESYRAHFSLVSSDEESLDGKKEIKNSMSNPDVSSESSVDEPIDSKKRVKHIASV